MREKKKWGAGRGRFIRKKTTFPNFIAAHLGCFRDGLGCRKEVEQIAPLS